MNSPLFDLSNKVGTTQQGTRIGYHEFIRGVLSLTFSLFSFSHIEDNMMFKCRGGGIYEFAILCFVMIFCGLECLRNIRIVIGILPCENFVEN